MHASIRKLSLGLTAALAIGFAVPQAEAGLLLEPYLSYHMGKDKFASDENVNGVAYGGRIGFAQMGLGLGLDVMKGAWTHQSDPTWDVKPSDIGVFVAYEFPVLLRVYGTYNFQSNLDVSYPAPLGTDTYKGTGFKLGVGTTILPFIALNLEYRTSTYTKTKLATVSYKQDTWGLSVSAPFDLL